MADRVDIATEAFCSAYFTWWSHPNPAGKNIVHESVRHAMEVALATMDGQPRPRDPNPVFDAARGRLLARAEYEALGFMFSAEQAELLDRLYAEQEA